MNKELYIKTLKLRIKKHKTTLKNLEHKLFVYTNEGKHIDISKWYVRLNWKTKKWIVFAHNDPEYKPHFNDMVLIYYRKITKKEVEKDVNKAVKLTRKQLL